MVEAIYIKLVLTSVILQLEARCHCDRHCCVSSWCDENGGGDKCVGKVPYCGDSPCDWATATVVARMPAATAAATERY